MVPSALAYTALPIPCWRPVGVLRRVFMAVVAVRLAEIRAHCQTLSVHAMRRVEQFVESFAFSSSIHERVSLKAGKLCKQGRLVFDPLDHDLAGVRFVERLIFTRYPAAIRWFVMAVVVDSLKRIAGRALPHVLDEGSKAVTPAITNLNPAATIAVEVLGAWVKAPAFDAFPHSVEGVLIFEWHTSIMHQSIKPVKE